MSIELAGILIAILAVGATLGGLILATNRGLRQDIRQDMVRLESRLDAKIDASESRLREDMKQMREDMKEMSDRLARVEHSQAKLEGLLEGLREAITGRAAAS